MKYKIIYNYELETVEITEVETNETLYSGSSDNIPDLPDFKYYIISKITLENYHNIIDEYMLEWDTFESWECDQCYDTNYDRNGEMFGITYEYWKGCFDEELTINADSNESLQDFITKLDLDINTFVFGSREIGEIDTDSYDGDSDIWEV